MPKSSPASPKTVQRTKIPHESRTLWHRSGGTWSIAEPAIAIAVAVLYVALALSNGGYSSQLIAGATVAIWWAVIIAMALGGWPRARVPTVALGAGACIAALAAWTAISPGWGRVHGCALFDVVRVL